MVFSLDRTYEVISRLSQAVTAQEICDGVTSFSGRYGLTRMWAASLPASNEHKVVVRRRHMLMGAFPPGWMDQYFTQDYAHIDPIVRRSKCDPSPFLWSEAAPFVRAEHSAIASRMFGEAAEFNLKAGFVVPMIALGASYGGVAGR